MIRGLLEKELRQHGFTLAFLGVLLLGGLALILGHAPLRRAGGGGFMAVQLLHYIFVPLSALVLGQVLVATEFRQKTQLFLEGLPLPRSRMLAVKFLLGLMALLGAVALALGLAWWKARHTEAMTPRFLLLLSLKSAGWVWFCHTLAFAHGFLGRYRFVFALAMLYGGLHAVGAGVELSAFGPFALVDSRFGYERHVIPTEALITTGLLGAGLTALAFTLGLIRDATVASLLAEKMSSREKIFMTMLALVGFMVAGFFSERQKAAAPVQIPGGIEAQSGIVQVLASAAVDAPNTAETAALKSVGAGVAAELDAAAQFLRCASFPRVFIVHRRDLEAAEFINGDLKPKQGVLVRANLTAKDFDPIALQAWLLREALLAHRGGLASRERNAWVHDGVAWWWTQSKRATRDALDSSARANARAAMPAGFSAADLRRWYTLRQRIGADKVHAFAGGGLAVLAQHRGVDGVRQFLSAMYSQPLPPDFRGWWGDVLPSTPARLQAATGWTEEKLVQEWHAALAGTEVPAP